MGKIKNTETNYATPSNAMTEKEMQLMVAKAQVGKFYSMQVLKQKIAHWKLKYAQ